MGIQHLQSTRHTLESLSEMRDSGTGVQHVKSGAVRARSLPTTRPFTVASFFTALFFLCLIGTLTAVVLLIITPDPGRLKYVLAGMGVCIVLWIVAFFKRRSALCPLCKGTPLLSTGARPHAKARRLHPFNHGMSATVSIIATQRFCCMYCGSDFDLLKTSSRLRGSRGEGEPE